MEDSKIKLIFSGDFVPLIRPKHITDDHFSSIKSILADCDLHITNLECSLTLANKPIEKSGPNIKGQPEGIKLLQQANVDIACLANNHIFDYGEQGILDSINVCEQNGIDTIGIVNRPDNCHEYLIKEIKDKKIGFLNYCEHEFSVREKGLLGACGYDPIDIFYNIRKLRPQVDYLIVIYHGGNEYYPLPRPGLRKDFHYMVDLGADAVIGHHTHVFSGYEMYNRKPLVYSLGNFFFPYEGEPESWHTGILCQLEIDVKIEIKLFPVFQCKAGYEVVRMKVDSVETILKEVERLSHILRNEDELQKQWEIYVKTAGDGLARQILSSSRIEKLLLRYSFVKKHFYNNKRRIAVRNILRCSSLEQLLIANLNSKKCS
jgi:poly-gamma-glutamate synthesis protein (capsule biosynthesis protein)